jgi:hypothetical protein
MRYSRLLSYVVLGIILFSGLVWLAHYLASGPISITTNNKSNTISLQRVGSGNSFTRTGQYSLSTTISHGEYLITVKNGLQVTTQVIDFKEGHKSFHYFLATSALKQTAPVAYENSENLVADNNQLIYLDASQHFLYNIDSQNNISLLNPTSLQTVKWVNPTFGIGQNSQGHLYSIVNGSVNPLSVPFSYNKSTVNFAVASNKQIYISQGPNVYAGSVNGNFKKIYVASSSQPILAASANKLAVADETEEQNGGISKPLLSIVNTLTSKVIKQHINVGSLSWSPNGSYLVSVDESGASVYDSSLNLINTIPTSSVVEGVGWLNNSQFYYGSTSSVWSYDISSRKSVLLANLPVDSYVTGLTLDSDKSYIYITTTDSSDSIYTISRIGLDNQPVSQTVSQLQNILPLTLTDCSLELINFGVSPTILLQEFGSGNLNTQGYINEADTGLSQDGFNLNNLPAFEFTTSDD